ncbi:hypothetical protein JCM18899A_44000 [Nocardioides sp. AN3]
MAIEQLQQAVDALAESLHRSVAIDDSSIRLVVSSRHFDDADDVRVRALLQRQGGDQALGHVLAQGVTHWTTAGVIPPLPEIGMKARVCVPIRWRAELLGLLMVMDADSTLTTAELSQITAAASDMAPYLKSMLEDDTSGGENALWDLVSARPVTRRQALTDIAERHDVAGFTRVVALHVTAVDVKATISGHAAAALAGGLRAEARDFRAGLLYAVRDSTAIVLLGLARAASRQVLEDRAARIVRRVNDLSAQRFHWVGGVGSLVDGLDRAVETAEQAELASLAAQGLMPDPVVFWDDLGAYASLLRIPPAGLNRTALPNELRRLLEVDADGQLTATVQAYLDHGGSSPDAADALHIHRTTLYYRIGRVQELAGLDLADGRTRLALHVGLELMRMEKALRGRSPRTRS